MEGRARPKAGAYSRRINLQHRLVYQVYAKEKAVKVLRMWTHYDRLYGHEDRRCFYRHERRRTALLLVYFGALQVAVTGE